jgi:chorismate dehydratase
MNASASDPSITIDASETGGEHTHGQPFRLGCVGYLNTLPLIEGLGKLRDVRLTLTAPARLSDLLEAGDIDMGLLSTIDFQRLFAASHEGVCMVPAGMIGCEGPTLTVRLFSAVPFEKVSRLHADVDSHTSVALARIVLAERFNVRPEVVDFDADAERLARAGTAAATTREWPESVLLIGDKVVTDAPPSDRYPHQLDLGEAWKSLTGLPFVYAVWMCRDDEASMARARSVWAVLDRQRRHNTTRSKWIIEQRAPSRGWPVDLASHYTRDLLRYDVTDDHRRAVETFFDRAHAHALIAKRRATRWMEIA